MKCRSHRNDGSNFIRVKYVPQWRFRMALGILFGFLVGLRKGMKSIEKVEGQSSSSLLFDNELTLLRPFKVPGGESLCPIEANSDQSAKNIYFIESSGDQCLTPRQACGVESAARANPDMQIYVYLNTVKLGPVWADRWMRPGRVRSCSLNQMLVSQFSNVQFIRRNFTAMLAESNFRKLVETTGFRESRWSIVQISDAVRVLLLQNDGGIYLDFDNIVFRPLHCLRNGFSYLEEAPNIENGIMASDSGHPFLNFLIRYLVQTYEPNNRVSLGPPAFGKAFKLFCQVKIPFAAGTYQCHGNSTMTLYHHDAFFPVKHYENRYLYATDLDGYNPQPMERAYLTHAYLSSWGTKVHPNSLYGRLARQYCPSVWHLATNEPIPLGF